MGILEWDLAQMTDHRSKLGRLVPGTRITVPLWLELTPDGRELVWTDGPLNTKVHVSHMQVERQMLNDFVRLWAQPVEALLKFARKWGILYLDQHGRPCQMNGASPRREKIEAWKYWSRRAQAVLNIAANLKLGNLGDLDDWRALGGTELRTGAFLQEMDRYAPFLMTMFPRIAYPFKTEGSHSIQLKYRRSVKSEKAFLSLEATLWLKLARVGFTVGVKDTGWGLWLDYNDCLFAAMALQLALVLADVEALFTCSGCHRPYARTKKAPKPDQANFCDECGRRKALKRADEKRRRKMATAQQLFREGVSMRDIAKRLNAKPVTVNGWLRNRRKP
jgi:transposase-like protein